MSRLASLLLVLFGMGIQGCSHQDQKVVKEGIPEDSVRSWASDFFAHYAERQDWERFLDRYADTVVFEDVLLQLKMEGKSAFAEFYDWPNPGFQKHPDYPATLVLDQLLVDGTSAVGIGRLTPFYWQDTLYELKTHGRFIMQLEFDPSGQIIRHTDWIDYPPID
ncbi:MAG: nuclear transport factor 2 family protein [Phaeodactylibacter sp.]|nr:nuclear transport factor 2 family protein [Phaeodactylibacter sp.]